MTLRSGDPCRGGRGPAGREPLPDRRHRSLPIDDGSCGRTGSRSWRRPDWSSGRPPLAPAAGHGLLQAGTLQRDRTAV